jgi:hypothetical protein
VPPHVVAPVPVEFATEGAVAATVGAVAAVGATNSEAAGETSSSEVAANTMPATISAAG